MAPGFPIGKFEIIWQNLKYDYIFLKIVLVLSNKKHVFPRLLYISLFRSSLILNNCIFKIEMGVYLVGLVTNWGK